MAPLFVSSITSAIGLSLIMRIRPPLSIVISKLITIPCLGSITITKKSSLGSWMEFNLSSNSLLCASNAYPF